MDTFCVVFAVLFAFVAAVPAPEPKPAPKPWVDGCVAHVVAPAPAVSAYAALVGYTVENIAPLVYCSVYAYPYASSYVLV